MLTESSLRDPVLINTVGHSAGVLLFGFVIALLLRDRENKLSILAAALAFGWNVGSLIALGAGDPDTLSMQIIMTASFAVLTLLPAVLLQVALKGHLPWITNTGYAISGAAILLHVAELFVSSPAPHQIALLLTAVAFSSLTVIATLLTRRQRPTEWLSLACLLLFVSSFPHFGYQHFRSPWAAEIAWHHIGIPVALLVLLQDYRFLLLDTFIRFLMNSGLAAAYVALVLFATQRFHLWNLIKSSVFLAGLALVAVCLSLILFAHVRNLLQQWIGRAIFRRENLEDRIRVITMLPGKTRSEDELISSAACQVAAHLRTEQFEVTSDDATDFPWAEAKTQLRFSSGEVRYLITGARRGRQRYLSEDLEDMRRLASVIVEQVERFRSEELRRLATQAELRALQAQINPHFLFNAFNTLYGTIDRRSLEARRLVLNLTEIFRYFLQGDRSLIPLSEELRIIKAYLEIEVLRLGDRLETELDVSDSALAVMIPVLSIQPLVENAVKHGVATKAGPGRVTLRAHIRDSFLRITIEDESRGGSAGGPRVQDGSGIGLTNVRQRLNLSYGPESTLHVSHQDHGTVVTLLIPAHLEVKLPASPQAALRVLIVDDEPIARKVLYQELVCLDSIEVVGEADSGEAALRQIAALTPDLVFLDIQMPGMSGFEVLNRLTGGRLPVIVIVTAFDQYAIRAFETGAIDYLLKPVSPPRLQQAVERASLLNRNRLAVAENIVHLQQTAADTRLKRIVGKAGDDYFLLNPDDVLAFQADGEMVWILTAKQRYLATQNLKSLAQRLSHTSFRRIHRNALVNINQIRKMSSLTSQRWLITLSNGVEFIVSKRQAHYVRDVLHS